MDKYTKTYNVILDNMDLSNFRIRPISAIMYLQDAFARFCASKKVAAYDLFPKNLYWIVTEFNINFTENLPFWSEEIKVEIWISELSKLKIYTDFNLYYKDKVFAKGNSLWFLIDTVSKKPVKTDLISDCFGVCNELVLGEHKKFILPDTTQKYTEITHINNLSDLDFNKHVNNKSYINLAEMTVPAEFKDKHFLKDLSIKFNKESFLGDVLNCTTYKTLSDKKFVNKIEHQGVSVCEISTEWDIRNNNDNILEYDLDVKHSTNKILIN